MKAKEKRNTHSYKIVDSAYNKVSRRAKKEKTTVANIVEDFLLNCARPEFNANKVQIKALEKLTSLGYIPITNK